MLLPYLEHQLDYYVKGSKHPPFNELDCKATLERFCAELLPQSPIIDPRRREVRIVKGNFPKLVDLEHREHTRDEHPANEIIRRIEAGTFRLDDYKPMEMARMRTLFWLPEVFCDPDSIYRNGHKIIAGDEVYVRVYDKMGSTVKLAFTKHLFSRGRYIRTIPITS